MLELIVSILQLLSLLAAFIFGAMSLSYYTDDHPAYTGKFPKGFFLKPWRFKQYWRPPGFKYSMYCTAGFIVNGFLIIVKYLLD